MPPTILDQIQRPTSLQPVVHWTKRRAYLDLSPQFFSAKPGHPWKYLHSNEDKDRRINHSEVEVHLFLPPKSECLHQRPSPAQKTHACWGQKSPQLLGLPFVSKKR